MTKHIDTLEAWFDSGETGKYKVGDTIICKGNGGYSIMVANHSATIDPTDEDARIIRRAPAPKPAWHDAVAVIASTDTLARQVWERDGEGWYGTDGYRVDAEVLEDVTPLIEAKVTDGMVGRIRELEDDYGRKYFASHLAARELLAAALGLDPA